MATVCVETCNNCGAEIGRLETPFVWQEHIVCQGCYRKLQGTIVDGTGERRGIRAALLVTSVAIIALVVGVAVFLHLRHTQSAGNPNAAKVAAQDSTAAKLTLTDAKASPAKLTLTDAKALAAVLVKKVEQTDIEIYGIKKPDPQIAEKATIQSRVKDVDVQRTNSEIFPTAVAVTIDRYVRTEATWEDGSHVHTQAETLTALIGREPSGTWKCIKAEERLDVDRHEYDPRVILRMEGKPTGVITNVTDYIQGLLDATR